MVLNVAELSLGELVDFARWLIIEGHIDMSDWEEILLFFEKPWKYDVEYDEYKRGIENA